MRLELCLKHPPSNALQTAFRRLQTACPHTPHTPHRFRRALNPGLRPGRAPEPKPRLYQPDGRSNRRRRETAKSLRRKAKNLPNGRVLGIREEKAGLCRSKRIIPSIRLRVAARRRCSRSSSWLSGDSSNGFGFGFGVPLWDVSVPFVDAYL